MSAAVGLFGCKPRQIVQTTPYMDIEPRFWLRVLLSENLRNCTLTVPSVFHLTDASNQSVIAEIPFVGIGEPIEVRTANSKLVISGRSLDTGRIIIAPAEPFIVGADGDDYRGKIELRLNRDGKTFNIINHLPVEAYLAGVVGAEMPKNWEPEALKAQAIAARTYCLFIKKRFGPNRSWDLRKTAANQVYLGIRAESAQVWKAVNRTRGQVLICQQNGIKDIFPAYYSSSCGGHTENSKNVFGDSYGPLCGVTCPYCRDVAKPKHFFWPVVKLSKTDISSRLIKRYPQLKALDKITNVIVQGKSEYDGFSRVTMVRLFGSNGKSDWLRGEDFRLAIDPTGNLIRSASFKLLEMQDNRAFLSGRGWGHGVGLCQCGTEGMARKGHTAPGILAYYYPGSKITRIY